MNYLEELLMSYRKLIHLLEWEEGEIYRSLDGELKEMYCSILRRERQELEENLILLKRLLQL